MSELRCLRITVPDGLPTGMSAVADELAGLLGGRIEHVDQPPLGVQVECHAAAGETEHAISYLACFTRRDFFDGRSARDWLVEHLGHLDRGGHSVRLQENVVV